MISTSQNQNKFIEFINTFKILFEQYEKHGSTVLYLKVLGQTKNVWKFWTFRGIAVYLPYNK